MKFDIFSLLQLLAFTTACTAIQVMISEVFIVLVAVFWRSCSCDVRSFRLQMRLLCWMQLVAYVELQVQQSGQMSSICHSGRPTSPASSTLVSCVRSLQRKHFTYLCCLTAFLQITSLSPRHWSSVHMSLIK